MSQKISRRLSQGARFHFPDKCIYCEQAKGNTISYPVRGTTSQRIGGGIAGVGGVYRVWSASTTLQVPYCEKHHREAIRVRAILRAAVVAGVPLGAALGYALPLILWLLRRGAIESDCFGCALVPAVLGAVLLPGVLEWLVRMILCRYSEPFANTPRFRAYASGSPGSLVPYPFSGLLGMRVDVKSSSEIELEFANDEIAQEFDRLN